MNNVAENVALFNGHPANSLPTGASASASAFEFHSRGSSPPSSHQRSPLPDQQQNGDSQSKPIENNVTDKVQAQKNQSNGGPRPWQNNHNNQTNQDRRSRGFQFNNQPQNRRAPGAFNPHHHHQGPNQFNRQQHYHGNNNGPNNNVMGYRRNQNGPISQNGLARPRNQQMAGRPLPPNMRPQFNDFKRVARKFDPALKTDYDFEKANQEFKELENKLGKLNVNVEWEGEQPPAPQAVDEEKTETEEAKSGDDECYDKKKSFFDKISCEAIERSKGLV